MIARPLTPHPRAQGPPGRTAVRLISTDGSGGGSGNGSGNGARGLPQLHGRIERVENDVPDEGVAEVRAALRGDSAGLGRLFERHRPRLERMVGFRLHSALRGRVDPADVVQESFADVLERLEAFLEKDGMDFFLWLRLETGKRLNAVHRQHLGAQARDVGREVPIVLGGMPGASSFALASALLDRGGSPSREVMKDEQGQRLRAAIDGMKEIDREVLVLRNFEQLSNSEVARVLDLSEPAATLRHVRALRRLQAILDDLEIVSESR